MNVKKDLFSKISLQFTNLKNICLIAFIVSLIVHLFYFILFYINGAIVVDEAMLLLNARTIADFQTDCLGEHLPIYFDTWLAGGQSPFATYLVSFIIKLFGYNLAVSRIPIFIFSTIGLIAFYYFLKSIFTDYKYIAVIFVLACFSPWHIFNSIYTLDCNFMAHILIIGMALLARAVKTNKTLYYAASMLFFGLCFYCYIAAAFIIPLLLVLIYLYLLKAKKISFKNIIISIVVMTVVSLPFILSGMVQLGIINDFSFLSISFSKMPYYSRGSTISFSNFFENLGNGIIMILFPDIYLIGGIGMMNSFLYTNFFGGIAFAFGIAYLTIKQRKNKDNEVKTSSFFTIPTVITFLIFCSSTFYFTVLYRYFSFNYIFILIEGIGFIYLSKIIKKINIKTIIVSFLIISTLLYNISYFTTFDKTYLLKNYWYINSFTQSVDYANELGYQEIAICFDNHKELTSRGQKDAVALRLHDYDNINNYYPLKNDLLMFRTAAKEIPLTKDNHYYYRMINEDRALTDDCIIMTSEEAEFANYDKSIYSVEAFGDTVVIYK